MIKGFKHNLALASMATAVTVTVISMLACGEPVQTTPVADIPAPRIVFSSDRDYAEREIYVMNADGSGQTNITNHPASDSSPSWGP
jgi:hypothetical protein